MRTNMRDPACDRAARLHNCALVAMIVGLTVLAIGGLYRVIDDVAISAMVFGVLALPMVVACSKLAGSAPRRSGR